MQQQPAMRTHTPEEEAETEWTRRQRLVENIANKQQQCRLIEDQGRQCSRTRPLTPECTDLLKMQIACYGELLCGDLSDTAVECLRRNGGGKEGAAEVACALPLRRLKECVQPRLRPHKLAFRQESARPAQACPAQATKLDACLTAARGDPSQPADPHGSLGRPKCPAELVELHECFAASVCPEPMAALARCLDAPARPPATTKEEGATAAETVVAEASCVAERRRVSACMQEDALRSYARQGIPLSLHVSKEHQVS